MIFAPYAVFLGGLRDGHSHRAAAAAAAIAVNHAYKQRRQDAGFRAAWEEVQSRQVVPTAATMWQQVVLTALAEGCSLPEIAAQLRAILDDGPTAWPALGTDEIALPAATTRPPGS